MKQSASRVSTIRDLRYRACQGLVKELEDLGRTLSVSSFVRRDAGDEAIGLVVQTAGALGSATALLLRRRHHYAAASLLRQLIEIEYLLVEFGRDPDTRTEWLREPPENHHRKFSPQALRNRANGKFSASQYGVHCRMGGHPNPGGRGLLPDHDAPYDSQVMLLEDLGEHLEGIWQRLTPLLPATGLHQPDVRRRLARVGRLIQAKHQTIPPSTRLLRALGVPGVPSSSSKT